MASGVPVHAFANTCRQRQALAADPGESALSEELTPRQVLTYDEIGAFRFATQSRIKGETDDSDYAQVLPNSADGDIVYRRRNRRSTADGAW